MIRSTPGKHQCLKRVRRKTNMTGFGNVEEDWFTITGLRNGEAGV